MIDRNLCQQYFNDENMQLIQLENQVQLASARRLSIENSVDLPGLSRMNEKTPPSASVACIAAKRPRTAAGVVSVAGLLIGFVLAYSATEVARLLKPASPTFLVGARKV
jgi:hypothetical protein